MANHLYRGGETKVLKQSLVGHLQIRPSNQSSVRSMQLVVYGHLKDFKSKPGDFQISHIAQV